MRLMDLITKSPVAIGFGRASGGGGGTSSILRDSSSIFLVSTDNTSAEIPPADVANAGVLSSTDKTRLDAAADATGPTFVSATVAEIATSTVRAGLTTLATLGHAAPGDGGDARYRRVDAEPGHALKMRSLDRFLPDGSESPSDGGWWEFDPNGPIDVRSAGAMPGAPDVAEPLLNLRDFCTATDRHRFWHWVFPPGEYDYSNNRWLVGLTNVQASGFGATIRCTQSSSFAGDYFPVGPREGIFRRAGDLYVDGGNYIIHTGYQIDSAAAGATTITLADPADADEFAVGDNIFLHGFCMQSIGYSPNMRYFEWATITAKAGAVLTLAHPLRENYDADWPDYMHISARTVGSLTVSDQFLGKPRIVNLSGTAQADGSTYYYPERVIFEGFKIANNPNAPDPGTNRISFAARHVTYREIQFLEDNIALDPRESEKTEIIDCSAPYGLEIDKLVHEVVVQGGSWENNPDTDYAIGAGTGCNILRAEGTRLGSRVTVTARDGLFLKGIRASGANSSDIATQAPLMLAQPTNFTGAYAEISGATLTRLPNQSLIGESVREWTYDVEGVDAADGTLVVAFDPSQGQDPPRMIRQFFMDRLVWLASDPRVRGRVLSVKDAGGNTFKVALSGPLPACIKGGAITAGTTLAGPVFERLVIDGRLWNDVEANQRPDPGLLDWGPVAYPSTMQATGANIVGTGLAQDTTERLTFEGVMVPGRAYRLTYDQATSNGSFRIRVSGSGANLYTGSAGQNGVGKTLDILGATGPNLEVVFLGGSPFNGTFTPIRLEEI